MKQENLLINTRCAWIIFLILIFFFWLSTAGQMAYLQSSLFSRGTSLEEKKFLFASGYQFEIASGLGMGPTMHPLLLSALGPQLMQI